jgi:hypothetical protein
VWRSSGLSALSSGPERGPAYKIPVIAAISRKGNIVCQMIENNSQQTLSRFVRKTVSDEVELLATDEGAGYQNLNKFVPHETVDHNSGESVRGQVHTNKSGKLLEPPETRNHGKALLRMNPTPKKHEGQQSQDDQT